ncbi:uncharacterized protein LOC111401971 isoform X2 [Olea europaea var. sylvestris]|uniref:uncharacterized protein LOC111401971 isoform X2 n=1 Tax=Olea europaea var. sylvestris TaxID=158386 RepID=UPI000C1D3596|nr:uncharacterized protein LOC111401971 isoform X2 [Olea europaea var. sylvestris]
MGGGEAGGGGGGGEKGIVSAAAAATEITLLVPSVTDANSRAFLSITRPLQIPNASPGSAIGFAPQSVPGFDLMLGCNTNKPNIIYPTIPSESSAIPTTLQVSLQVPRVPAAPILLGKGAKQWRDIAIITIMHLEHNVIGAKLREVVSVA